MSCQPANASTSSAQHLLVASHKSLTAISDMQTTAIYDSNSMVVSLLDLPFPPVSKEELQTALVSATKGVNLSQSSPLKLPVLNSAFGPLMDRSVSGSLSRLTLNIANACNLWCSYCYADHGTYHTPVSLMTPEQAVAIVGRCLTTYPSIRSIQFFGGEPLLNPMAIEAVCLFLEKQLGSKCPEFTATTNGTILDEKLERILQRFNFSLTISVDGPAQIHDQLRPAKAGASSHVMILRNIERLRKLGIAIDFECTYTFAHHRMGISVCDLLDYFSDEIGETNPHIAWSYLPKPKPAFDRAEKSLGIFRDDLEAQSRQHIPVEILSEQFRAAARKSMQNIALGNGSALTFVIGVLERLKRQQPTSVYCPAFTTQLSISANGTAYPCFMFIGDARMKLGNILDPGFPDKQAADIWEMYRSGLGGYTTGTTAWYAALVSGCVAGDYISTGGFSERLYEPVQEAMIEEIILGLAQYYKADQPKGGKSNGA